MEGDQVYQIGKVYQGQGRQEASLRAVRNQQNFLCDVIQQKDRENDGMSPKEVAEAMLVLNLSLPINQSWDYSNNTMLVKTRIYSL